MCQRVEVVSNAFCRQNMDSVLHTMSFKQSSCGTKCESNGVFIELCWCFSFCQKLIVQICLFSPLFFHGTNLLWQTWAMFDFLRPCACDLLFPCGWIERSASLGFSSSEVFTAAFKVLHEPDLEAFPQAEDLPLAWKALHFSADLFTRVIQVKASSLEIVSWSLDSCSWCRMMKLFRWEQSSGMKLRFLYFSHWQYGDGHAHSLEECVNHCIQVIVGMETVALLI